MRVADLMIRNVATCDAGTNLESVAMMMWEHDCGAIPVMDHARHAIGMITDRDISMASALNHKPLWNITPQEVMHSRPLYTCNADDDIKSAMKIMWAQKVRRLPVVNGQGELQGIVSVDDIVACAERGSRGQGAPALSYDDAMATLKAVCKRH